MRKVIYIILAILLVTTLILVYILFGSNSVNNISLPLNIPSFNFGADSVRLEEIEPIDPEDYPLLQGEVVQPGIYVYPTGTRLANNQLIGYSVDSQTVELIYLSAANEEARMRINRADFERVEVSDDGHTKTFTKPKKFDFLKENLGKLISLQNQEIDPNFYSPTLTRVYVYK